MTDLERGFIRVRSGSEVIATTRTSSLSGDEGSFLQRRKSGYRVVVNDSSFK